MEDRSLLVADPGTGVKMEAVDLDRYVSTTLAEPRWAVDGIWPDGAMGVIGGRPKDGKSTIAAELAISLWSGTRMFGLEQHAVLARPEPVLYVQQENADARVQRDLQQILAARGLGQLDHYTAGGEPTTEFHLVEPVGADLPAFHVMSHQGLDLSRGEYQAELERRIKAVGYRYLFLDPLYNLVGATKIGDGGDDLRPVLTWLTHLKNALGCAPVITHHMTDKGGEHGASALLGTTYMHAWYEAALFPKRSPDDSWAIKVDALRSAAGHETRLALIGMGVGSWWAAAEAQGVSDAVGRAAPRKEAAANRLALYRDLVEAHPEWTQAQLADELQVSERTVRTYARKLEEHHEA